MKKRGLVSLLAILSLLAVNPAQAQYVAPRLTQRLLVAPAVISPTTGLPVTGALGTSYGTPYGYPYSTGYSPLMSSGYSPYSPYSPYGQYNPAYASYQQYLQRQAFNARLIQLAPIMGMAIGSLAVNMFNSSGNTNAQTYSAPTSYAAAPASYSSPSANASPISYAGNQPAARAAAPDQSQAADIPANPKVIKRDGTTETIRTTAASDPGTAKSSTAKTVPSDADADAVAVDEPAAKAAPAEAAKESTKSKFTRTCLPITETRQVMTANEKKLLAQIKQIANCGKGQNGTQFRIDVTPKSIVTHIEALPAGALSAATAKAAQVANPLKAMFINQDVVLGAIQGSGLTTTVCRTGDAITAHLSGTGDLKGHDGNLKINMDSSGCFKASGSITGGASTEEVFSVK
jgi:hypothetical protein